MRIPNPLRRPFRLASSSGIAGLFPVFLPVLLLLLLPASAVGEVPLPVDPLTPATVGGVGELDRALARLSTHRRLLVVAAHPDDEDTALLTYVARALGGESAYLSLSRGDGGQNLIGDELGVGLGLLRSRELQAAREIDGARQYFSRAYDFGYTRSLDETLRRWPEDVLLEDALRVVRRFRPQVIVAIFPADERAGHGQHQASGVIARRAFDAAREDAVPPRSFLRAGFFLRRGDVPSFTVPLGVVEPFRGKSVFQIAMESRSRHRCQNMGLLQPLGDAEDRLIWEAGESREGLFDGIDVSLASLADPLGDAELRRRVAVELDAVETLARTTRDDLAAVRVDEAVEPLAEIVRRLRTALAMLDDASAAAGAEQNLAERDAAEDDERIVVRRLVAEKEAIAVEALATAAGIAADAWTARETATPGSELVLETVLWNSGPREIADPRVELSGEGGSWAREPAPEEEGGRSFFSTETDLEERWRVRVPGGVRPTAPYFLRRPLDGDLYDWSSVPEEIRGQPFGPPPLRAVFHLEVEGVPLALEREVVYRMRDQARGEVRRPLRIVPKVEVSLDRDLLVVSTDPAADASTGAEESGPPPLEVRVRSHGDETLDGELRIELADLRRTVPLRLGPGELKSHRIDLAALLSADLPPDRYRLRARFEVPAEVAGAARAWSGGIDLVDYEHIRPVSRPVEAELDLVVAPVALPELERVAYVRGASDRVPEMLAMLGLPVEVVRAQDLEDAPAAELAAHWDAIVVGSRAYEVDPALPEINQRLLDYAREGGLLVVQYQQYGFSRGAYAPYPLEIRRPHDRITDETGPVRVLRPGHPIFHRPNEIGPADWHSWVQERGLYFAGTWDEAYTPLLAMTDPLGDGEEKRGGLLVADLGEGRYVYTGIAFFRQLPAGVPGAYRLFANLLAAGR